MFRQVAEYSISTHQQVGKNSFKTALLAFLLALLLANLTPYFRPPTKERLQLALIRTNRVPHARICGSDQPSIAARVLDDGSPQLFQRDKCPYSLGGEPPEVACDCYPSDWYLRRTAEGTKVLTGESPNTPNIPISP